VPLGFHIKTKHLEDDIHRIVEIQFRVTGNLVVLIGKQGLQSSNQQTFPNLRGRLKK